MTRSGSLVGQTVSHYQVIDEIGAGGMGVVYRAHDDQLDRDVALKVLPVGMLADERSRKQFHKEALALARLNHPNIGTVHEFSNQDGIDFLVMELIIGRTLSEKLQDGLLAQQDVLRLAMQLSDGLTAAHERGIIHRDLKPGNLIVMPDGRLKILDFGLAELFQTEASVDLTQSSVYSDRISGTLPYMSPEQLRGMRVDPRSDVFAAGAVLYEMATGRRPFPQLQTADLMGAILHKTPDPPSALNAEVSPGLERIICKALEKDPSCRYHTARELHVALEAISASSVRVAPVKTPALSGVDRSPAISVPPRRSRWIAASAGLVLILTAGVYLGLNWARIRGRLLGADPLTGEVVSALPIRPRRSVAVLGFKNVSNQSDKAWVSTAISEMLTTELSAGEQLRIVSGEDVARMKASLSLPETDSYGHETLQRIHKTLDADIVVLGSYIVLGDGQFRLDLRLQDTQQGETLVSISEKGNGNQVDELAAKAGALLREKLGVEGVSLAEAMTVKATLPETPGATRLYAEGIARLRAFDYMAARDLLQKAVLEDPNLALAHSALASAYSALGYDEKALQSARNAFELSSRLSREDRLLIEARYREVSKEWDHAVESYRVLFGFFPDNLEYGLLLAGAQVKGGSAKDALSTVESLRRFPPPPRDDPRIDLRAAQAYVSLGEFAKAHDAASSSAEKARQNNTRLILADSLLQSGQASESLNQTAQAGTEVAEAEQIYNAAGDRNGEAKSLEVMANVLADKSDFSGAVDTYKKQLTIARGVGNRRLEASALNNMAIILNGQGHPDEAKRMWEQSLQGFRDVNDKADTAEVLINIGGLLLDEGELVGAKQIYERALSISQEVNDQNGISTATTGLGTVLDAQGDLAGARKLVEHAIEIDLSAGMKNAPADKLICLGDVLRHEGDLALAKKTYQDALAQSREGGDKSNAAYALTGLGDIALDSADLRQANNENDEALAIRMELKERKNIAITQLTKAELAVAEGNAPDASTSAKGAIEQFQALHSRDDEITATIVLAHVLLLQGKVAEANRELSVVAGPVSKSQSPVLKIKFAMATAQVELASGHLTSAKAHLNQALAMATKFGMVKYQLECRLAMESQAVGLGKSTETRTQLDHLEKDATDKGFILIANKAAEIRSR